MDYTATAIAILHDRVSERKISSLGYATNLQSQAAGRARDHTAWFAPIIALLLLCWAHAASAANYVYDNNGRLAAITASDGNSAAYSYDAVGNVASIQRIAAGQLALFVFNLDPSTPNQVIIQGSGFSPTPGNNTVNVNGTQATVVSATVNQLTVQVSSGVTAGPISVTVGSTTVTSTDNYINQNPAITGFSPSYVDKGGAVTVTGSNFVAGVTKFGLAGSILPDRAVVIVSATQATITVPTSARSGPIQVITQTGSATSANDLVVVPSGIGGAINVTSLQSLTLGASQNVSITTSGKYALMEVNSSVAVAGSWFLQRFSSFSPTSGTLTYSVYNPAGLKIANGTVSASTPNLQFSVFSSAGAYVIAFTSLTAPVQAAVTTTQPIIVNVNDVTVPSSTTVASQRIQYSFAGTAGQSVALNLNVVQLTPTTPNSVSVTLYRPDGQILTPVDSPYGQTAQCLRNTVCRLHFANLPQAGSYLVSIVPAAQTMSVSLGITADVTGALTADSPLSVSLAAGQLALLNMAIDGGQTFKLIVSGIAPSTVVTNVYVFDSTGAQIAAQGAWNSSSPTTVAIDLPNLSAGFNSVLIVPPLTVAQALQVTLISPITGTLLSDGSSHNFATSTQGQDAVLSFSGVTGQYLALGLANWVTSSNSPQVQVVAPDGTATAFACYGYSAGCTISLPTLTESGTYRVLISSYYLDTMSFTATLSQDVVSALNANSPMNVVLAKPGQTGYFTFTWTTGQTLTWSLTNLTISPSTASLVISVQQPDGSEFTSIACDSTTNCQLSLADLPQTGTYAIVISPGQAAAAATASFTQTLSDPNAVTSISADAPTLPQWAAILMGLLLMGMVGRSASQVPAKRAAHDKSRSV